MRDGQETPHPHELQNVGPPTSSLGPPLRLFPSPTELVTFLVTGKGDGWGEEAEDRERR